MWYARVYLIVGIVRYKVGRVGVYMLRGHIYAGV